jgi:hypothetical protein
VADRQPSRQERELGEDRRGALRRHAGDALVEADETIHVVGDDTDGADLAADADADADTIVAGVFGPLYYRRWFSREPIDEAFVRAIVAAAVP